MAVTEIVRTPTVTIDPDDEPTVMNSAHRLSELVQALTGCSVEGAELAVGDPMPGGPMRPDDALDVVATALVRLRRSSGG